MGTDLRAASGPLKLVQMRNFHFSGLVAVAVLSFGCSAAQGEAEPQPEETAGVAGLASAAGSPAGGEVAVGHGGQGAAGSPGTTGGIGGALAQGGAASSSGGTGGTPAEGGTGGSLVAPQAGAGGNAGSGGNPSAGAAGSASAGASGGPTVDPLAPYPGCAAGFTDYNVPVENCIKIVGRFVVGDPSLCNYDYSKSPVETCATWTSIKKASVAMVRAQPGYTYKVTRFVGACPVLCTAGQ
jgi:hypothetical protein